MTILKPGTKSRLLKVTKKVIEPQSGWLDVFDAVIGKADGTVLTGVAGEIWVRNTLNGQPIKVHNSVVPAIATLQVEVGRRVDQPGIWRVKGEREVFTSPAGSGYVPKHGTQHTFPAYDTVWINRKQILALTVLVSNAAGFIVQVYGGLVRTTHGIVLVDNETIDLSSYVPVSGSIYVAIECDADGALSVHAGTPFGLPADATYADVPTPDAGKYTIAFILLHYLMTALSNDVIGVPVPLVTDYTSIDTGYQIDNASADTPLDADEWGFYDVVDAVLKKITWANIKATLKTYFDTLYAALGHTHTATTRWEPLANGDPSSPALVFTPDGDVIMVEVTI
jgi:preprotein translocase subunit SecE